MTFYRILGFSKCIIDAHITVCFHDQAIADLVKCTDNHHNASTLLGQLYFLATFGNSIANHFAGLMDHQHMTHFKIILAALIEYHRMILAYP